MLRSFPTSLAADLAQLGMVAEEINAAVAADAADEIALEIGTASEAALAEECDGVEPARATARARGVVGGREAVALRYRASKKLVLLGAMGWARRMWLS